MNLEFDLHAFQDLTHWVKEDKRRAQKILLLVEEILKTPFSGTGKPEPLKHALTGCWSRRIDQEHRLVYTVSETKSGLSRIYGRVQMFCRRV